MKFFLGMDGGGTRTRAFLVDASAQRAGWGEAGLTNPNHATAEEVQTNLEQAIRGALQQADAKLAECVSAFTGMAGVTTENGRSRLRTALVQCGLGKSILNIDHDIRIALAGGLALRPGIALVVGTGSSCYGRTADGRHWQTGGWEALISDEGSAFFLAREAIAAAARMADGRTPETPLRQAVFDWLGIGRLADILPRIHDQGMTRSEIASFAPSVMNLARAGDAAAEAIARQGAKLLAEMIVANHRLLPTGPHPDVVITGGLGTADAWYREQIAAATRAELPTVHFHQPLLAPAVGAALLAMVAAGAEPNEALFDRLKQHTP